MLDVEERFVIRDLGYRGKETRVRSFVQRYRQRRQGQVTVRFQTDPGRQAQVDWANWHHIKHRGRLRWPRCERSPYHQLSLLGEQRWCQHPGTREMSSICD
jgi:hypothetical protein